MKNKKMRRSDRGYTLVELMVTVVVVSILLAAAYQLFASTSEAMYEADSLADTVTDARFGLELVARDVQSAGAFSTPDSTADNLVNQAQLPPNSNIYGVYALDANKHRQLEPLQTNFNPATASDEIVLLGAYDYPFSFEVGFPDAGNLARVRAVNSQRGALRFTQLNPFDTRLLGDLTTPVTELSSEEGNAIRQEITPGSHLMRLTDRNGYMQFAPVTAMEPNYTPGLTFDLGAPFQERPEGSRKGIEPSSNWDVRYEVALLDALRYRVCIDPGDVSNLQLVKERLVAGTLITNPGSIASPAVCGVLGTGVQSQSVLVDRVADFRVWYSCGVDTGVDEGKMVGRTFHGGWIPPYTEVQNSCAYIAPNGAPVDAARSPFDMRMAHLRLSVRTDKERLNVSNFGFITQVGTNTDTFQPTTKPLATGEVTAGVLGGLQTFDTDGNANTAARVTTLQVDVGLRNFGNRLRIQRVERDPTRGF